MQNVWGEESVPENALSRKFLDPAKGASGLLCRGILYRRNRALTPEGGGKRTVRGGGPKPLFGRGVIREVFHPPLFSTPPWRPLNFIPQPPIASLVAQARLDLTCEIGVALPLSHSVFEIQGITNYRCCTPSGTPKGPFAAQGLFEERGATFHLDVFGVSHYSRAHTKGVMQPHAS